MKRKILIYILLFAFINYITGCAIYKSKPISLEKYEPRQKITKVVTESGYTINFVKEGGYLIDTPVSLIVGTNKGRVLSFPSETVREIRTKLHPVHSVNAVVGKKLYEIVINQSRLIQFDSIGGVYSPMTKTIYGHDLKGREINVPIEATKEMYEKPEIITLEDLRNNPSLEIAEIIDSDKVMIRFDAGGKYLPAGRYIAGLTQDYNFSVSDFYSILSLEIERYDPGLSFLTTIGAIVGILGLIGLIIAATKESCPFIYSFNGSQFVFDAEPLGGATSEVHQRSDLSRLEHLTPVNGKYKLMISNEVNETQYLDALKLEYIDHDSSYKVYPSGKDYYFVEHPETITSCVDENGRDLNKFLIDEDGTSWMTHMTGKEDVLKNKIRHQLTITLPKPHNAQKVNLIINAGTTLWGSNMIREMLNMYGSDINNYYERINTGGTEYQQTMRFLGQEELFQLKLYVKSGNEWIYKGLVDGGGPLICETRIIQLDLSDVKEESLILRFNPPVGFWTFDFIAADYSIQKVERVNTLNFTKIFNTGEENISGLLSLEDNQYYSMPDIGTKFYAEFDAPPVPVGMTRSIFANTSGYYKIHTDDNGPMQADLLYRLILEPGYIVKLSTERYYKWFNEMEKNYIAKKNQQN